MVKISASLLKFRALVAEIQEHPLCGEFMVLHTHFQVMFPVNKYATSVDGIRIVKKFIKGGQIGALEHLLLSLNNVWRKCEVPVKKCV